MNNPTWKVAKFVAVLTLGGALAIAGFAGTAVKWQDLPAVVRATILANGGTAGQAVDLEDGKTNGMAIYEAGVKDKNGNIADLVIAEDGKLVESKHDDAADNPAEAAARAQKVLAGVKFSHPRDITNPYLPLASLKQDILEGSEGGKKVHIERTLKPDIHKTFKIGDQTVESLAMEDREWVEGQLEEVATDYFAQDDGGTVYYLGEDVDDYVDGKVVGHDGAWLLGKDTQIPGIILPGHPKIGDKFRSEDVSKDLYEADEVVSLSEDSITPSGNYQNCLKTDEHLSDGTTEHKYYVLGVGVVREVPAVGDERLISHTAAPLTKVATPPAASSDAAAREALKKVGTDPEAEAIWIKAINDPNLPADARASLIEDLNEVGFADPAKPTKADLSVITNRLELIKRLRPKAMDDVNAAALDEARKDLENMAAGLSVP